jgi:hypothetical protein
MPPTPAPGGRIIAVGPPNGRVRKGAFDGGLVVGVLAIAATITIVWRAVQRSGARQRLL